MKVSSHTAQALRTPLSGRRGFEGSAGVAKFAPCPICLPSSPARYALGVGERRGGWLACQWHTILPLRLRPHQQLALSSSALPHRPICPVLSCEAPEGSQLAFASGDVVDGTDATGIRSITERHSLPPSSHVRTAVGPSCDVLSLVGSDTDLSCSVGMTR
jgi:hypothetical protein